MKDYESSHNCMSTKYDYCRYVGTIVFFSDSLVPIYVGTYRIIPLTQYIFEYMVTIATHILNA